jgi:hypothetical protein
MAIDMAHYTAQLIWVGANIIWAGAEVFGTNYDNPYYIFHMCVATNYSQLKLMANVLI